MLNYSLNWDVMTDIKQSLSHAITLLAPLSPSASIDAEILLAYTLDSTRTFLYTYPEKELTTDQWKKYQQLLNKRAEGRPIAYLTGTREFWSLPLQVSENTLIPRPETELLVELALTLLNNRTTATILDLGTGSGAIALAIASAERNWQVHACDCSEAALTIAKKNAMQLGLSHLHFFCSDWFSAIPVQKFDAILSNPPYIAENDPHLQQGDVRFEPQTALVAGVDGLDALRIIIHDSYDRLQNNGLLLLEHGYDQKQAVAALLKECGYLRIQSWQDWQGNDRVSAGWR